MARKSRDKVIEGMHEWVKYRWECLRRNSDYRKGYNGLFEIVWDDYDTNTEEGLNRYLQERECYEKKYGGVPATSKKDLKKVREVAKNPEVVFDHGNLYIVTFCEEW